MAFDWFERIFKTKETQRVVLVSGGNNTPLQEESGERRMDAQKLRTLYHNTNNAYALGAHLVKPIIENNVGFVFKPNLYSKNTNTNNALNEFNIPFIDAHRIAEREGDLFIWPKFDAEEGIVFELITIDKLDKVLKNNKGKVVGYIFKYQRQYYNESGILKVDTIILTFKNNIITHQIEGGAVEKFNSPLGRLPIFQMSNGREVFEETGHSEIENIEPQMKFYHDQTYEAGSSQKRDGHPKMKVNSKDPRSFIDNNFGTGTFDKMLAGQAKVSLEGRDLFILNEGEDVEYIVASQATGDYAIISKRTFTNLVEGSGTPEVVFGANLGTSLASVKEQRPVWIKKILLKQENYNSVWKKVLDYTLELYSFATFKRTVLDYSMEWPKPDFKSDEEKVKILKDLAETIITLKDSNAISDEEIYDTLKMYPELKLVDSYKKHFKLVEDSVDNDEKRLRGKLNTNNNASENGNEGSGEEGSEEDDKEKDGETEED